MIRVLALLILAGITNLFGEEAAPIGVRNSIWEFSPPGGLAPRVSYFLGSNGMAYLWSSISAPIQSTTPYSYRKTSSTTGVLQLGEMIDDVSFVNSSSAFYVTRGQSGMGSVNIMFFPVAIDAEPPLRNVSSRTSLAADGRAIAGFVVAGQVARRVLVRGIGPSLALFGVQNVAANPILDVTRSGAVIGSNGGWGGSAELVAAFSRVGAFALPATSRDSAILLTLDPGDYTAQVSSSTAGEILIEVYYVE